MDPRKYRKSYLPSNGQPENERDDRKSYHYYGKGEFSLLWAREEN